MARTFSTRPTRPAHPAPRYGYRDKRAESITRKQVVTAASFAAPLGAVAEQVMLRGTDMWMVLFRGNIQVTVVKRGEFITATRDN